MTNIQERIAVQTEDSLAEISKFETKDGVTEYHVIIHATHPEQTFQEQLNAVLNNYYSLLKTTLKGASSVIKRYFLSDAANQYNTLLATVPEVPACACSVVEQAPLDGTKIALWVNLQTEIGEANFSHGLYRVKHGAYTHLWGGSATAEADTSEGQTSLLLKDYVMQLLNNGAHFIASTGIGGRNANPKILVQLDNYAVIGIDQKKQVKHLYAPTHLNPTYEYGVSFERGTRVDYGDRRQVFISGTASIDNKGNILHVGDIRKQTERMWENVDALLKEAECGFDDVSQMIVYLRDPADHAVVSKMFNHRFPDIPKVIVLAPVCRPGWLIEMECMATKAITNEAFPKF